MENQRADYNASALKDAKAKHKFVWFRDMKHPRTELYRLFDVKEAKILDVGVESVCTDGVWDWYSNHTCGYYKTLKEAQRETLEALKPDQGA